MRKKQDLPGRFIAVAASLAVSQQQLSRALLEIRPQSFHGGYWHVELLIEDVRLNVRRRRVKATMRERYNKRGRSSRCGEAEVAYRESVVCPQLFQTI